MNGKTIHYVDYLRDIAAQLPQFEDVNHLHVLRKIYKRHGMPKVQKYIKHQWIIYNSIMRKQHPNWFVCTFWDWYYQVMYNV